jgi:hypothetical protein
MVREGVKLSRRKEEAITALLTQSNVDEAARVADIRPQTLRRWMREPVFEAAWREARQALVGRAIARVQRAAGAAVTALLKVMIDTRAPASARLRAAEKVIIQAQAANEMDEIEQRVVALERAAASQADAATVPARKRGSAPIAGHGAKFSRKKEEAIAALLVQPSVAQAARATGIGTQTLYRWLKHPEFEAAMQAARRAAHGTARTRLQQAAGAAVTTVLKVMSDPDAPVPCVRAADLVLRLAQRATEEDIEARLEALGCATPAAPAVPRGEGRTLIEMVRARPKLAA